MIWKRKLSKGGLLYVILDTDILRKNNLDIFALTKRLSLSGADMFQLRAKNLSDRESLKVAKRLSAIIHKFKKIFIVNDRVDIAYLSKADGVHLGENDIEVKEARRLLGGRYIIGKTTHSYQEIKIYQNEKVDYLSLGPAFRTETKLKLPPLGIRKLRDIIPRVNKPLFIIGGVNINNIDLLLSLGVKNIAICQGILLSENYRKTTEELKKCLKGASLKN